jgi:hypothetical protein
VGTKDKRVIVDGPFLHRSKSCGLWVLKLDLFLCLFPSLIICASLICVGTFSSRLVTLDTVEIFTTHEWFAKPTVAFRCNGANKTYLPDVTEAHTPYTFKGEESWQASQTVGMILKIDL